MLHRSRFVARVTLLACGLAVACGGDDTGTTTTTTGPTSGLTTELAGASTDVPEAARVPLCETMTIGSICDACLVDRCCPALLACAADPACACTLDCPPEPTHCPCGWSAAQETLVHCTALRCAAPCAESAPHFSNMSL